MKLPAAPKEGRGQDSRFEQGAKYIRDEVGKINQTVQAHYPDFLFDEFVKKIGSIEDVKISVDPRVISMHRRGFLQTAGIYTGAALIGALGSTITFCGKVFDELDEENIKVGSQEWYDEFGKRIAPYTAGGAILFPVLFALLEKMQRGDILETLNHIPDVYVSALLVSPEIKDDLDKIRESRINPRFAIKLAICETVLRTKLPPTATDIDKNKA